METDNHCLYAELVRINDEIPELIQSRTRKLRIDELVVVGGLWRLDTRRGDALDPVLSKNVGQYLANRPQARLVPLWFR